MHQIPHRVHAGGLVGEEFGHCQRRRGTQHPPRFGGLPGRWQADPAEQAGQADAEHGEVDADAGQPGQQDADHEQVGFGHGDAPATELCGGPHYRRWRA
ncbi:hypothetical protein G6F54_013652 [Rhizopus delemar]|nr:hypothetical protein G6F54_013652 [Rhizopus delemar]